MLSTLSTSLESCPEKIPVTQFYLRVVNHSNLSSMFLVKNSDLGNLTLLTSQAHGEEDPAKMAFDLDVSPYAVRTRETTEFMNWLLDVPKAVLIPQRMASWNYYDNPDAYEIKMTVFIRFFKEHNITC